MKKIFLLGLLNLILFFSFLESALADQSKIGKLKEMFEEVTIKKNAEAIPLYYDNNFELYTNGKKMNFDTYLKMHREIYKTPIQYKVSYDEEALVEQGNKVAARLFITTKMPNELVREIEVILLAEYKDDKLFRLWELTYPDWSKLKAFQKNS